MKIAISLPRPRNRLVALARLRRAGAHRIGEPTRRQSAQRQLRRELTKTTHSPP